ncbi:MAG: hypothetical protein IJM44_07595 [Ruminococcus sp.]|nr:hypothetical protein [Ruminococcus sp.]
MKIMKITAALLTAASLAAAPASTYAAEAPDVETSTVKVEPVYKEFNELEVGGGFIVRLHTGAELNVKVDFDSPEVTNEPYYSYDITDSRIYGFEVEGRTNTLDDYRYYHLSLTAKNDDGVESETYKETFEFPDINDSPDGGVAYAILVDVSSEPGEAVEVEKEEPETVDGGIVFCYRVTFRISDFVLGDVNSDGLIDGADASAILVENAAVADNSGTFTDVQKKAADINGDGLVDSADASLILAYNAYAVDNGTLSIAEWFAADNA